MDNTRDKAWMTADEAAEMVVGALEKAVSKLVIWTWCPVCGVTTDQEFEREDSRNEYYRCTSCGQLHTIAVR